MRRRADALGDEAQRILWEMRKETKDDEGDEGDEVDEGDRFGWRGERSTRVSLRIKDGEYLGRSTQVGVSSRDAFTYFT